MREIKMETKQLKGMYAGFVTEARDRVDHLLKAHDYLASAVMKGEGGHGHLALIDEGKALRLLGAEPTRDCYDTTRTIEAMKLCDTLLEREVRRVHDLEGDLVSYVAREMIEDRKAREGERVSQIVQDMIKGLKHKRAA